GPLLSVTLLVTSKLAHSGATSPARTFSDWSSRGDKGSRNSTPPSCDSSQLDRRLGRLWPLVRIPIGLMVNLASQRVVVNIWLWEGGVARTLCPTSGSRPRHSTRGASATLRKI